MAPKKAPKKKAPKKVADPAPTQLSPADRRVKRNLLNTRINQVHVDGETSVADLVEAMSGMSIQARNLGMCAQVMGRMYQDKARPTIFLGLAGASIVGSVLVFTLVKFKEDTPNGGGARSTGLPTVIPTPFVVPGGGGIGASVRF